MERARTTALAAAVLGAVAALAAVALLREDPARPGPGGRSPAAGTSPGGTSPLALETPASGPTSRPGPGPSGTAGPAPDSPRGIAISGFVRDHHGSPVAGARVSATLDPRLATTARADGTFRLELPATANLAQRIPLLAQGPSPLAPRLAGPALPGTRDLVIVLRPGEGTCRGRVVRSGEARTPVAGASVEAGLGDWLGRATTDGEGRFRLEGAPAGSLAVTVSAEGLVPRVLSLAQGRGAGPEHEIALDPGTRLVGRVVQEGKPAAGATVRLLARSGVPLPFARRTTTADSTGAFAFDALPGCEAIVHARLEGRVSGAVTVRSDGHEPPEPLTLALGAGLPVQGRIVASGAPVAGARVVLEDPLTMPATTEVRTGPDGKYRLGPVAAEGDGATTCRLRIEAKGFTPRHEAAQPGFEQDLELSPGASLVVATHALAAEVLVRDSTGDSHALVPDAGPLDETGRAVSFRAGDLAPGETLVSVRAKGKATASARVQLAAGQSTRVELEPTEGRRIAGRCTGDDGLLLGGVSISANDASARILGTCAAAESGEDGSFELGPAPEGKLGVVAVLAGYRVAFAEVEPGATRVDFVLERSWAVEVQLTGPAPVPRAWVELTPLDGKGEKKGVALGGASGVFEDLRGARYLLEAFSPGLAPGRAEIDPREGATVAVALTAGAKAEGVVVDGDGTPLPGTSIVVGTDPDEDLQHAGTFARLLEMTEDGGTFSVTVPAEGADVVVTNPKLAPLLTHLAPGPGQKIQLAPGARITGLTLGRDGSPQARIGVALEGPLHRRGASGPDGSVSFQGLLPGKYRLRRHDAPEGSPGVEATVGARGSVSVELRAP